MTVPSLEEFNYIESTQELNASQKDTQLDVRSAVDLNAGDISGINVQGDFDIAKLYDMLALSGQIFDTEERDKVIKAIWCKIEEFNNIPFEIKKPEEPTEINTRELEANEEDTVNAEPRNEIEASKAIRTLLENYLIANLDGAVDELDFTETVLSCCYMANKNFNWGSPRSISRHLTVLTSRISPFELIKNANGKKIIKRRESTT